MAEKFQNDNNTDNQNTLNIPIPPNPPPYRKNSNTRRPQQPRQNTSYNTNQRTNNYNSQTRQSATRPNNPNYQRHQQNPNSSYRNPQYNNGYQSPQYNNGYYTQRQSPPPQKQYSAPRKYHKKKKHKSFLGKIIKRIIFSLLTILVLLFGIYSCTALTVINKIGKHETGERFRTAGTLDKSYVKSVLIIGSDGRSEDDAGRSDSMILLSLNSRTNEVILTSFMRDCYVNIPNYGMDKLNAAYSYGGAELLMDTIESNFMIEINDYVTVNFISFAGIIDSVGGIDIDVTDEEAQEINNILFSEVNQLMGDDQWADFLEGGGKLHLNGKQALSYARIRYVGNSDFERTSRQREVITKIIPKAVNPATINRIAKNVVPKINTNMSSLGMYILSLKLPLAVRYDVKQIQIPADGTFYPEDVWTASGEIQNVLQVDLNANYNILENEIFDH